MYTITFQPSASQPAYILTEAFKTQQAAREHCEHMLGTIVEGSNRAPNMWATDEGEDAHGRPVYFYTLWIEYGPMNTVTSNWTIHEHQIH